MSALLLVVLRWALSRLLVIGIALAVMVGALALYYYLGENVRLEQQRKEELAQSRSELKLVYESLEASQAKLGALAEEAKEAYSKIEAARETIAFMEGLMTRIEYLFMTAKEQYEFDKKLEKEQQLEDAQEALLQAIRGQQVEERAQEAGLGDRARFLERQIVDLESSGSELARYLIESWRKVKPYLLGGIALVIAGPFIVKGFAFYVIGSLLAASRAIVFSKENAPVPEVGQSGVSASVEIGGDKKAWIKEAYLQASDEDMKRRTRFILDWRVPVTCIAAGLVEMIEFAASKDGDKSAITVSTQDKPEMEICLVSIPKDGSLMLRPSYIVGVVSDSGEAVKFRRHWRLFHIQSWITLQFRYFEIQGPCSVLIAGIRGARKESMHESAGRRVNQRATIGFTPALSYGAARAETFWSYFRGLNPLFDDVFRGSGVFLCQEISSGQGQGPRRFWAGIWNALLKVLGV